jgi:hypothetical protein
MDDTKQPAFPSNPTALDPIGDLPQPDQASEQASADGRATPVPYEVFTEGPLTYFHYYLEAVEPVVPPRSSRHRARHSASPGLVETGVLTAAGICAMVIANAPSTPTPTQVAWVPPADAHITPKVAIPHPLLTASVQPETFNSRSRSFTSARLPSPVKSTPVQKLNPRQTVTVKPTAQSAPRQQASQTLTQRGQTHFPIAIAQPETLMAEVFQNKRV